MRSPWGSPSSLAGLGSVTSDCGGRSDTITQSWPQRKPAVVRVRTGIQDEQPRPTTSLPPNPWAGTLTPARHLMRERGRLTDDRQTERNIRNRRKKANNRRDRARKTQEKTGGENGAGGTLPGPAQEAAEQ